MKARFPPAVPIHNGNPADVGGGATADDYNLLFNNSWMKKILTLQCHGLYSKMIHLKKQLLIILQFPKKRKKPILCGGNGGPYTEKMIKVD